MFGYNKKRKQFRYYLKADANTYYYESGRDVLTTSQPKPLIFDPLEWKETDLRWARNVKYHGIFRSFVVPLSFVKDGAHILRHICATQSGYSSVCILDIQILDHTTQLYKPYYTGNIDFSKKRNYRTNFQAEVIDAGLAALVKAKESTPQEIVVKPSNDALNILMDGIRERNTSTLVLANDFLATNTWHQMMPTIAIQSSESDIKVDVIAQTQQQGLGSNFYKDYPFYRASIDGTVYVDYNVRVQVGNSAGSNLATHSYVMLIRKYDPTLTTATDYFIYNNPNFVSYVALNEAIGTKAIQVNEGDVLVYFAGLFPFNGGAGADAFLIYQTYEYSTFNVRYDLRLPTTEIWGDRYYDFYRKFVASMTAGAYQGVSTFLSTPNLSVFDNKPYNTVVTCGDALRGLGRAPLPGVIFRDATIKTTLDGINDDAAARWMTGIGVERDAMGNEVLRLEPLAHFYQNDVVLIELGEVKDVVENYAEDYIFNLLKVGTANQDYDNLNGKDEPNTTQVYELPETQIKNELNLVSPYRADMYGVEFVRANLSNKKTTDNSSDNDTFVIEVQDSPVSTTYTPTPTANPVTTVAYKLQRLQNNPGNFATGLISAETAFNLGDTPRRRLMRNGPRIHTALYQLDNRTILFKTTDKNDALQSRLSTATGLVVETSNISVGQLAAPLFLPIYFEFETKVVENIGDLIAANPYGRINFKMRDKNGILRTVGGFIDEVSVKPADRETQTWKLIACPDTDLSLFIFQ